MKLLRRVPTLLFLLTSFPVAAEDRVPRVFITTDIGINDPDDDQSVCHLLHYADEVELVGLVPDLVALWNREDARARLEAVLDAYESDFQNPTYRFDSMGHPSPQEVRRRIHWQKQDAIDALIRAARQDDARPLYVLAWGKLQIVSEAIARAPDIVPRIRLFTIGTHLKAKHSDEEHGNGTDRNWNWIEGRDAIFNNHPEIWWIESDWTYNGMFPSAFDDVSDHGDPVEMREVIKSYGRLGHHLWHIGNHKSWSGYFRCGDTPSLNYVLDPYDDEDPGITGWAGRYVAPFREHPNYHIGVDGGHTWDYAEPRKTWDNAEKVFEARVGSLLEKRQEMYDSYLLKLNRLYARDADGDQ